MTRRNILKNIAINSEILFPSLYFVSKNSYPKINTCISGDDIQVLFKNLKYTITVGLDNSNADFQKNTQVIQGTIKYISKYGDGTVQILPGTYHFPNPVKNNRVDISIGHKDNYNIIRKNHIKDSGKIGIFFREERENFTATGNKIEENVIENVKSETSPGIFVQGLTNGNEICRNEIVELSESNKKIGIKIAQSAKDNTIKDNKIKGFAREIVID